MDVWWNKKTKTAKILEIYYQISFYSRFSVGPVFLWHWFPQSHWLWGPHDPLASSKFPSQMSSPWVTEVPTPRADTQFRTPFIHSIYFPTFSPKWLTSFSSPLFYAHNNLLCAQGHLPTFHGPSGGWNLTLLGLVSYSNHCTGSFTQIIIWHLCLSHSSLWGEGENFLLTQLWRCHWAPALFGRWLWTIIHPSTWKPSLLDMSLRSSLGKSQTGLGGSRPWRVVKGASVMNDSGCLGMVQWPESFQRVTILVYRRTETFKSSDSFKLKKSFRVWALESQKSLSQILKSTYPENLLL